MVFELERGSVSVGDRQLLDDAELWLERGEHVSIVGANGTGKTTLIESLAGRREFGAPPETDEGLAVDGKLRTGHNVKIGYLSQHAEELVAGNPRTVLEATQHATGLTPAKARALLGGFLFSGEDAEKPLDGLSGGERRRLSLAILVHSGANVLILDEPTNHLDLESREALEAALRSFAGSLPAGLARPGAAGRDREPHGRGRGPDPAQLRGRMARVSARPRAARAASGIGQGRDPPGRVHPRPRALRPRPPRRSPVRPRPVRPRPVRPKTGQTKAKSGKAARSNNKRNPPKAKEERLEHEIEAAEATLRAIEDELADPAAWSTPEASARSTQRHEEAKRTVAELLRPLGDGRRLAASRHSACVLAAPAGDRGAEAG